MNVRSFLRYAEWLSYVICLPLDAEILDRGAGLVYDTTLNITWLQNANSAGAMSWSNALSYATSLDYYDAVRDVHWTDWRLPSALRLDGSPPLSGNTSDSEPGHLYFVDGVSGHQPTIFSSVAAAGYWLSTPSDSTTFGAAWAWYYNFGNGLQNISTRGNNLYVWPVRDGDVLVPEPSAITFLLLGLLGVLHARHRKGKPPNRMQRTPRLRPGFIPSVLGTGPDPGR